MAAERVGVIFQIGAHQPPSSLGDFAREPPAPNPLVPGPSLPQTMTLHACTSRVESPPASHIAAAGLWGPLPPPCLGVGALPNPRRRPYPPLIRLTTSRPRGVAAMESSARAPLAGWPPFPYCPGASSPLTKSLAAAGWPFSPRRVTAPARRPLVTAIAPLSRTATPFSIWASMASVDTGGRRRGRAQFRPGMCRKGTLCCCLLLFASSSKLSAAICFFWCCEMKVNKM
jgi:hypothetical protein